MAKTLTLQDIQKTHDAVAGQSDMIQTVVTAHGTRAVEGAEAKAAALQQNLALFSERMIALGSPVNLVNAYVEYIRDAGQRSILTMNAQRLRSDIFLEHQAANAPPVLDYDYDLIMDGKDLPRPCNYILLRIMPPEGTIVSDTERPYVIIDPRAGHGAGIGGFKQDSQVGVALRAGHPVYFVAFRPVPEPGQTLACVTEAEAMFLRKVEELHPDASRPIVIGNCQGGWATAILAATNPDLTGPIVLNGAPMSYWGGKLGQDPMRYSGGLAGGVAPAMMAADLGGGIFDGAALVQNFEMLNPARNWFGKYYDLFRDVDSADAVNRFLEFERWWGGFYLMTGAEIEWIVSNLFVGNKLGKNQAQLEPGHNIDLKAIRAPIICFASHGDNITPPAQALNWIMDTYADEREIEILGQRILYMVHDKVGHLGIFVSSSIANREHSQMESTLHTIEALAPGLYEILIEDVIGHGNEAEFKLAIAPRKFEDIIAQVGPRKDEAAFTGVARLSEQLADSYDATLRPVLRAAVTPETAEMQRAVHPMRTARAALNSGKPGMKLVHVAADKITESRRKADPENPFLVMERIFGQVVENSLDVLRDVREAHMELTFLTMWANPVALAFGHTHATGRTQKDPTHFADLPEVKTILRKIDQGGLSEAIIRMLVLVAGTRNEVRHDRLQRSMDTMHNHASLADMQVEDRVKLVHEQTVIAHFAKEQALSTLPVLLITQEDRQTAIEALRYVVGSEDEMAPETRVMVDLMSNLLDLPAGSSDPASQTAAE